MRIYWGLRFNKIGEVGRSHGGGARPWPSGAGGGESAPLAASQGPVGHALAPPPSLGKAIYLNGHAMTMNGNAWDYLGGGSKGWDGLGGGRGLRSQHRAIR